MSKAHKLDISEDVVASICCRQAMADVSHEMIEYRDCLANVAGLRSEEGAFWERLSSVSSGKRARVDGPKEIRASMQAARPDYQFEEKFGDEVRFTKPLTKNVVLSITFVRINFHGLGKAYRVGFRVGRVGEDSTLRRWFEQDVFELFGDATPSRPVIVYQTAEYLRDALAGVQEVLSRLTTVVETKLKHFLAGSLSTIPPEITVREQLSARSALNIAKTTFANQLVGCQIFGIDLRVEDLHRHFEGPAIRVDGTPYAHGYWLLRFVNVADTQQVFDVEVPYASNLQIERLEWRHQPRPEPIHEEWLDSREVVAIAESAGGNDFRESGGRFVRCSMGLRQDERGVVWDVHYWLARDSGTRADYSVQIDAMSGEVRSAGSSQA